MKNRTPISDLASPALNSRFAR